MSRIALFLLAALAALPGAQAADFDDYARVVNVTPQMQRYNRPVRECHTEVVQQAYVQPAERNSAGGAVVGAIAGGLLGNQIGGGSGRAAATAAGVLAGAAIGNRAGASQYPPQAVVTEQPVERCRMVDQWESRPAGYTVTYEYHGHTYTHVLPYDPGQRLRVAVSVTPVVTGEYR